MGVLSRLANLKRNSGLRVEPPHYERDYNRHVANLQRAHPHDEAMALSVGGQFELMGKVQVAALRDRGLVDGMAVVDFGCGSGRTAVQLAEHFPNIAYVGVDVVQDLLDYAAKNCPRHFRFIKSAALELPIEGTSADMIIAFSVFTHLHHEETYAYLQDFGRVLKAGGKVVFSFLEFSIPYSWHIFEHTVAARKSGTLEHANAFIERSVIEVWAQHLGFAIDGFFNDGGQTVCMMRKDPV